MREAFLSVPAVEKILWACGLVTGYNPKAVNANGGTQWMRSGLWWMGRAA